MAAVILGIASPIAALSREIAARWRGIVIAHLFFLTLWLAIQVFFFATGAYWCVPSYGPKIVQWVLRTAPRIARCGPVSPAVPLPLSPIVATPASPPPLEPANPPPALAPGVIPPAVAPPVVTQASPPLVAEGPAAVAAAPAPAAPSSPVAAAPAPAPPAPAPAAPAAVQPPAGDNASAPVASVPLPPARWSAAAAVPAMPHWSAAAIPNCWRDRSVNGGSCYQGDTTVPPRPPSRARNRTPAYAPRPPPTPEQCPRRPWECWPDYGDYF